jgi:hypothetical protein
MSAFSAGATNDPEIETDDPDDPELETDDSDTEIIDFAQYAIEADDFEIETDDPKIETDYPEIETDETDDPDTQVTDFSQYSLHEFFEWVDEEEEEEEEEPIPSKAISERIDRLDDARLFGNLSVEDLLYWMALIKTCKDTDPKFSHDLMRFHAICREFATIERRPKLDLDDRYFEERFRRKLIKKMVRRVSQTGVCEGGLTVMIACHGYGSRAGGQGGPRFAD